MREIRIRARENEPDICVNCVPRRRAPCGICGRIGTIAVKASEDSPAVGHCCYRPPVALCSVCGQERPCYHADGPEPICPNCSRAARKKPCLDCGRERPPSCRVPGGVICDTCAQQRPGTCEGCGATAPLQHRRCPRCNLAAKLATLAAGAEPAAAKRLAPYLMALAEASRPDSTLRWMRMPTFALLNDLLAARTEISHAALDARREDDGPPGVAAVEFLRAGLLDAGVLEAREEAVVSFERWLCGALARLPDGRDRALVRAYASWEVAPRLSRASRYRRSSPGAQKHCRSLVSEAIKLTAWLAEHGLALGELRQDLLDAWVDAGASTRRRVRLFVAWLARTGAAPPLRVEWDEHGPSPGPLDEERRLAALRSLLHEEHAAPPERLAGCLLLLFGQPLTRSAALRAEDVGLAADGEVTITVGRGPITLPEPLGALARAMRGRALERHGEEAWLFPGRKAGTHLTAEALRCRLRRHGISSAAARHAALLELAARLPAPILAERFGFHHGRAAQWVRAAGDTYAGYVALRSAPGLGAAGPLTLADRR